MIREVDYTIKRLDEWYYGKFKEKYTIGLALILKIRTLSELSLSQIVDFFPVIWNVLSVKTRVSVTKYFFSEQYKELDDRLKGKSLSGLLEERPEIKDYEDFYRDIFYSYDRITEFVNSVRKKSCDTFPNELEDRIIDSCFKDNFRNAEYFSKLITSASEHFLKRVELMNMPYKEKYQAYAMSMNNAFEYMFKKVFEDVYR